MCNKIILVCLALLTWGTMCLAQESSILAEKSGITLGTDGSVYVLNQDSDTGITAEKHDRDGNYIKEIVPEGPVKDAPGEIQSIASDSSGNVYMVDDTGGPSLGSIFKLNSVGEQTGRFRLRSQFFGVGVAVDAFGNIIVLSRHGDGSVIEWFKPSAGKPKSHVISLPASIRTRELRGIAPGTSGNFYLGDTWDSIIYKFSLTGKQICRWKVAKGWNYSGCMAVDLQGNLYIGVYRSDSTAVSVQKFDPSGRYLSTFPVVAKETYLLGITVSSIGDVYTVDQLRIVRRFNPKGKLLTKWKMRTRLP